MKVATIIGSLALLLAMAGLVTFTTALGVLAALRLFGYA